MSLTLRGMIGNAVHFMARANPITGPYFLAKDLSESKSFQDSVKVATESTKKAAKALNDGANAVLDYPIEKGAKQLGDSIVTGYNNTVDATVKGVDDYVVKPTIATGKAIQYGANVAVDATVKGVDDYVVKPTIATGKAIQYGANVAVDATVEAANDVADATVNAANDYVVNPTLQAVDDLDKGQKTIRNGLADWIKAD